MKQEKNIYLQWMQLAFRIAISITLLSAVADRFGYWGTNAVWGNWKNFETYTGQLLYFLPASLVAIAAVTATILEIVFAILLLVGYRTKQVAFGTGCLLLSFGISMLLALGAKATLDYSVWVGACGCWLLAGIGEYKFSIDYLKNRKHEQQN